jgi:signal peptidase I
MMHNSGLGLIFNMKKFLAQHYFQIATLVVVVVVFCFVEPFTVNGRSMAPTFQDGDIIFVERLSHHFSIQKNDVLVFRYPRFDKKEVDIKRVYGVPLETITLGNTEMYLGKEDYFMAGDNRQESTDSRDFGTVQMEHVIGKPFFRVTTINGEQDFDIL